MLHLAFETWSYRFRPFTTFHLVMAGSCFALIFAACWFGGRLTPASERRFRLAWGGSIIACQTFALIWRLLPVNYTLEDGLPLQLCRIAGWVCGFSMLYQWRWARSLTYFWGIGLCLQGLVTPLRLNGLASVEFWLFWTVHLQIVGAAIYDCLVLRFRPSTRDYLTAAAISTLYVAIVIPFNLAFDTNYGWLGTGAYRTRNIIDLLGTWPQRAILLVLIAHLVVLMLFVSWRIPRWLAAATPKAPPAPRALREPRSHVQPQCQSQPEHQPVEA